MIVIHCINYRTDEVNMKGTNHKADNDTINNINYKTTEINVNRPYYNADKGTFSSINYKAIGVYVIYLVLYIHVLILKKVHSTV